MPPLITSLIPDQKFQIIRDAIGSILSIEIANQEDLSADGTEDKIVFGASVYAERISPFEHDEIVMINVQLADGEYNNKHQGSSDGEYGYYIDIYATAKAKSGQRSDERSRFRLHRLLGAVRFILEYTGYKTLGFDPSVVTPFIKGSMVTRFKVLQAEDNQDAQSTTFVRLLYTIRANEVTDLELAGALNEYHTQVKLAETDKGFRYENEPSP